jgi:hypothetical protein
VNSRAAPHNLLAEPRPEDDMDRTSLLRNTYRLNAAATLACGLGLLAAGHLLAPIFAVPAAALWTVGALFLPFAAWIWSISRRARLQWSEAAIAGALDGTYALASFVALAELWPRMTPELRIAVALVAAPVALAAIVELTSALRLRSSPAAA